MLNKSIEKNLKLWLTLKISTSEQTNSTKRHNQTKNLMIIWLLINKLFAVKLKFSEYIKIILKH